MVQILLVYLPGEDPLLEDQKPFLLLKTTSSHEGFR